MVSYPKSNETMVKSLRNKTMSLPQGKVKYTPEQNLELERACYVPNDYVDGRVFEVPSFDISEHHISNAIFLISPLVG